MWYSANNDVSEEASPVPRYLQLYISGLYKFKQYTLNEPWISRPTFPKKNVLTAYSAAVTTFLTLPTLKMEAEYPSENSALQDVTTIHLHRAELRLTLTQSVPLTHAVLRTVSATAFYRIPTPTPQHCKHISITSPAPGIIFLQQTFPIPITRNKPAAVGLVKRRISFGCVRSYSDLQYINTGPRVKHTSHSSNWRFAWWIYRTYWKNTRILRNSLWSKVRKSKYESTSACPSVAQYQRLNRLVNFNPLNTKRRLLYLKTQFVPRSKHFSSRLLKPISLCCKWHKSLFVLR